MQIQKNETHLVPAQQTELLIAILTENNEHVVELNRLLQLERNHLENRQRQELVKILDEKSICLQKIDATERRLEQLLLKLNKMLHTPNTSPQHSLGLINPQIIESIIERVPNMYRVNLRTTWELLKKALHECQTLNAINGQIIHKSKANVETILEMMRGYGANLDIYHADGSKERASSQRTLAKA